MRECVACVAAGISRNATEACEFVAVGTFNGYSVLPCVVVYGARNESVSAAAVEHRSYFVRGYFGVIGQGVVAVSCVAVIVEGYPYHAVLRAFERGAFGVAGHCCHLACFHLDALVGLYCYRCNHVGLVAIECQQVLHGEAAAVVFELVALTGAQFVFHLVRGDCGFQCGARPDGSRAAACACFHERHTSIGVVEQGGAIVGNSEAFYLVAVCDAPFTLGEAEILGFCSNGGKYGHDA